MILSPLRLNLGFTYCTLGSGDSFSPAALSEIHVEEKVGGGEEIWAVSGVGGG